MNKMMIKVVLVISLLALITAGCGGSAGGKELVLADCGWDSIKFHNAVAGLIAEEIFGYTWSEIPGTTAVLHEGLLKGEIDAYMEIWTDNIPVYEGDLAAVSFKSLA